MLNSLTFVWRALEETLAVPRQAYPIKYPDPWKIPERTKKQTIEISSLAITGVGSENETSER